MIFVASSSAFGSHFGDTISHQIADSRPAPRSPSYPTQLHSRPLSPTTTSRNAPRAKVVVSAPGSGRSSTALTLSSSCSKVYVASMNFLRGWNNDTPTGRGKYRGDRLGTPLKGRLLLKRASLSPIALTWECYLRISRRDCPPARMCSDW